MKSRGNRSIGPRAGAGASVGVGLAMLLAVPPVLAFEFDTGNGDLKIRWDNTLKYSAAVRLKEPSAKLTSTSENPLNADMNDGDLNFKKGLISNRIDLLSEFDAKYKNAGARVSAAAWYDDVYNRKNDNPGPSNNVSVPFDHFTKATRDQMGCKAEFLDAFVFADGLLGDMLGSVKLGRHTMLWGESLFFGNNGIAGGQAPLDINKLALVPGSQFKEIARPDVQLSGQLQVARGVSVGAYYKFKWHPSIIPPAGSYLSQADGVGVGSESHTVGDRLADVKGKNSGQGGLQLRYTPEGSDVDYGVYAIRYNDTFPIFYVEPAGGFRHVYQNGVNAFGLSASTTLAGANVAAEVSMRSNAPLALPGFVVSSGNGYNDHAIGRTAHANISAISLLPRTPLWPTATLLGEIAWNRTLSVTRNAATVDPNSTRDATAMRLILEPQYFQVLPGLDISVPIGLGYGIDGRSSAVVGFSGDHTGDFSIGIKGTYQNTWKVGLNYTKFLGKEQSALILGPSGPMLSYAQPYKDRDFISLYIQNSF